MALKVSDVSSPNETIVHAADVIGRSPACRAVFEAIYRGKTKVKTVSQLMEATGLTRKQVLTQGKRLADNHIVTQAKRDGQTAYEKDSYIGQRKRKVLGLVDKPSRRVDYPTKGEPRGQQTTIVKVQLPRSQPLPQLITIDDVASFAAVKEQSAVHELALNNEPEARIKRFLQRVIGQGGEFTDWGGEKNDLYTTRLNFRGRRRAAAFALKGRATSGTLTPKKMGKNGDQIARLLSSEAEVFFVVYHSKIDESVVQLLHVHAVARAAAGARVYYCPVDGDDLARLVAAYPLEYEASA